MNDIGAELAEICEAAAALILPLWRSGLAVTHKADESPVTEADQRGEALILKVLAERFPDIPVISEEDASEFGTPDAIGPRFFLVDPMDSSIKLCRIAEGAADIYPRHGPTMEWDTAAGHAVLEAAGGRLTTVEGEPFVYGKAQDGFRNGWFVARGR